MYLSSITSNSFRHTRFLPLPEASQLSYEQRLVSLLLKNPADRKSTQQIHSHLVTTSVLFHKSSAFNALLRSYSLGDFPQEAFLLFKQLNHNDGCNLSFFDSFTYSFLLKACANLCSIFTGCQLHELTLKLGFESHVHVQTALVNMYADCGFLVEATRVFDEMPQRNSVTWNVMITGLIKWGDLATAHCLFNQMPNRTIVSWTGIIDGYTRMNKPSRALELFRRMALEDGIQPSEITLLAIFPAISTLGNLKLCQCVHAYGEKKGFCTSDIRVANSLIDSYAKCGCMGSALKFFEELPNNKKNLVSWTSIITGLAMHGKGKKAVESFVRMENAGFKPNRITLLSVLNACSHGGLVDEGIRFFEKMVGEYQIPADIKHYGCVVDMLGRAGRLEEAEKMALEIPAEIVNDVIWRILLGACSFHGNVEMAERVTRKILEIEKEYGGDYVLMSNILTGAERFGDAENIRKLMEQRYAFKLPGQSLV